RRRAGVRNGHPGRRQRNYDRPIERRPPDLRAASAWQVAGFGPGQSVGLRSGGTVLLPPADLPDATGPADHQTVHPSSLLPCATVLAIPREFERSTHLIRTPRTRRNKASAFLPSLTTLGSRTSPPALLAILAIMTSDW